MRDEEIMPLTEWKRDTAKALKRLHARKGVQVLTVNGREAAVVLNPTEYRRLREQEREAYVIQAVEEALVARDKGAPTYSVPEVFDRLRKRHAARLKTAAKSRKSR